MIHVQQIDEWIFRVQILLIIPKDRRAGTGTTLGRSSEADRHTREAPGRPILRGVNESPRRRRRTLQHTMARSAILFVLALGGRKSTRGEYRTEIEMHSTQLTARRPRPHSTRHLASPHAHDAPTTPTHVHAHHHQWHARGAIPRSVPCRRSASDRSPLEANWCVEPDPP